MNPFHCLDRLLSCRPRFDWSAAVLAALLGLAVLLTGCTSPTYKAAPKNTPPPVLINLPSTDPPIEALLHTVIIFRGPGSWKRNAYWDEYVVTVANRGNSLVTVESASLTDFENATSVAGDNPWELERISHKLADEHFGFVKNTVVQIGGGVTVVALGSAGGSVLLTSAAFGATGGAVFGGILILPAFIGGSIYTNISNRHAIEQEFELRRLVLPTVLVPGELVQGSLFFRISPGPQRLTLHCRVDDQPRDVVIDLAPIAGLHLKSPPVAPRPVNKQTVPPKK